MQTIKTHHGKPAVKLNIFADCYDQSGLEEWKRLWNAMMNEQRVIADADLWRLKQKGQTLQIGDDFVTLSKGDVEKVLKMAEKHVALFPQLADRSIKGHNLKFLGAKKWRSEIENVIANVGFQAVGQILVGTYGSTGEVTYAALGSGSTTPTAGGTQLTTEVYRNAMFSGTVSSNVTYLTAVYNETETSGTYNEFGNFIDGTGTANSGVLWSWILTGGWVKTTSDVLVVDQKYTFTSS